MKVTDTWLWKQSCVSLATSPARAQTHPETRPDLAFPAGRKIHVLPLYSCLQPKDNLGVRKREASLGVSCRVLSFGTTRKPSEGCTATSGKPQREAVCACQRWIDRLIGSFFQKRGRRLELTSPYFDFLVGICSPETFLLIQAPVLLLGIWSTSLCVHARSLPAPPPL